MKLKTLKNKKTITQGHTDELKIETKTRRVWLSRMTKEDGAPYDNQVTEEVYNAHRGTWETLKTYKAI